MLSVCLPEEARIIRDSRFRSQIPLEFALNFKPAPFSMKKIVQLVHSIPMPTLVIMTLLLGMAPFVPEPHLVEKIRMLFQGTLTKPIDIFDLVLHSIPALLLLLRLTTTNSVDKT